MRQDSPCASGSKVEGKSPIRRVVVVKRGRVVVDEGAIAGAAPGTPGNGVGDKASGGF